MPLQYNKVLNVEDFDELGLEKRTRKNWEIEQALRSLKGNGAIKGTAEILGAGAGHEATIFHLSTQVRRVWATDLYANPGEWGGTAPNAMLSKPEQFAPPGVEYDPQSIVVQHMDMTNLYRFPDSMFHGAFSSGSIEHVGTFDAIARAAAELGRVLRKGGVLSLSTEWKISGPGWGFDNVLLFDEERLNKYIIEPSGCKLTTDLDTSISDETLKHEWSLERIVRTGQRPETEAVIVSNTHGYKFTSVHICLVKE